MRRLFSKGCRAGSSERVRRAKAPEPAEFEAHYYEQASDGLTHSVRFPIFPVRVRLNQRAPMSKGQSMSWDAVYAAGTAVNQQTGLARPDLDASLRAASEAAKRVGRGAAQSDGEGRYTGLPVARFQQALYAKNVEWRFTDRTLCVLWKLELPLRADYFSDIKKIHWRHSIGCQSREAQRQQSRAARALHRLRH